MKLQIENKEYIPYELISEGEIFERKKDGEIYMLTTFFKEGDYLSVRLSDGHIAEYMNSGEMVRKLKTKLVIEG